MEISFTEEEKIKCFDEIISHFYNANFGQMSKSDIELMMFNFYIKKMISSNGNEIDHTIDYNKCSDYRISRDLGITQQRVRNLKVKNQLVNPIEFDWKAAFAKLIENARYDKEKGKVSINIPDPNLFIEIRNFIEEHGGYIEIQLNSKILQLRVEYYIDLVILFEPDSTRKQVVNELKKQFKKNGKDERKFNEREIGKTLVGVADIASVAVDVMSLLSSENIVGRALMNLIVSRHKK